MSESERKIALFDLDGTLINAHLWWGLFKSNLKRRENLFSTFRFLAGRLALVPFWKIKLISTEKYYQSWGRNTPGLIKGVKVERAKKIFDCLVNQYLLPTLKSNVLERLKKHQKEGFLTILTSGNFQNLVEIVASRLNIDFAIGTELEVNQNKFSGKIIPPLCFGQAKAEKVKKFLSDNGLKINFKESFTYSDSFFDLPFLELVGNPVAVDPDKKLLEIAKSRGWQII